MSTIVTPHAAVLVWNYRDRVSGNTGLTLGASDIDQTIISTVSLISISTSKEKSAAHGQFEITLAPTKNWIATLTPGSWMCVMMSLDKITQEDMKKANSEKVKFFGRIDSVRSDVTIDQSSGARSTIYRVSGPDWGQVFNTNVYVDPLARSLNSSDISTAARFIYEDQVLDSRTVGIPTSTQNLRALLNIWGGDISAVSRAESISDVTLKPSTRYEFPKDVSDFFGFKTKDKKKLVAIKDIVNDNLKNGRLKAYDEYDSGTPDGVGLIQPGNIFGNNNFWQLINDNCNPALNEVISDIRWENGEAKLTLYNRIKPFVFRKDFKGKSSVSRLYSSFQNVRKIDIPEDKVISINAGTNWRDKYNFAEIQIDQSLHPDVRPAALKQQSQELDPLAIKREGFRPIFITTKYFPPGKGGTVEPRAVNNWKFLMRQWYFDIHRLLNGSISFTGINEYIQVGDNIMFPAKLLNPNNNTTSGNLNKKDEAYILAHVESISHNFSVVSGTGARSYTTTVNFVRALFVDADRNALKDLNGLDEGALDLDAASIPVDSERNRKNTISTSAEEDPDEEKYRGN